MTEPIDVFGDVSKACDELSARDKALARAIETIGAPHIRRRPGGFAGLFRIIVEQQVSVASAQAIWGRCQQGLDVVTPAEALKQGEAGLKTFGLSGPKARYVMCLAEAIDSGAVDLENLPDLDDANASVTLQSIKGVGPWTAAIYLLFCEGRVDIWPPGDVALLGAYKVARRYGRKPVMKELDGKSSNWSPWRGVAAHTLWTYYAHIRNRTPI